MSFDDPTPVRRPPVFASMKIAITPIVTMVGQMDVTVAELCIGGLTVTVDIHEARALCTALSEIFRGVQT